MHQKLTEEDVQAVLEFVRSADVPPAASNLPLEHEKNLLAVRELLKRGDITCLVVYDSTRVGDTDGRFIFDAARIQPA